MIARYLKLALLLVCTLCFAPTVNANEEEEKGELYTIAMRYLLADNKKTCSPLAGYKLHTVTMLALEFAGAHVETSDDKWTSIAAWIDNLKKSNKTYRIKPKFSNLITCNRPTTVSLYP